MSELAELKSVLRSLVVSSPLQMTTQALLRDYRSMMGIPLPFQKFGYRDPISFLREQFGDCFLFQGVSSNPVLVPIVPDELKHIDKFVKKQKIPCNIKHKSKRSSVDQRQVQPAPDLIAKTFTTRVRSRQLSAQSRQCLADGESTTSASSDVWDSPPVAVTQAATSSRKCHLPEHSETTKHTEDIEYKIESQEYPTKTTASNNPEPHIEDQSLITNPLEVYQDFLRKKLPPRISTENVIVDSSRSRRNQLTQPPDPHRITSHHKGLGASTPTPAPPTPAPPTSSPPTPAPLSPTSPTPTPTPLRLAVSSADSYRSVSRCSGRPADPDDALPYVDFDPDVFPADCMSFVDSIPAPEVAALRPGDMVELMIGEVYSPSHFWFYRLGLDFHVAMEDMMDEMTQYYSCGGGGAARRLARGAVRVGQYCTSVYERDWHRSLIVRELDCDTVKVLHVDYGTVERAPVAQLKPLLRKWAALPAQALRGRLAGIRPVALGRRWPRTANVAFLDLVRDRPFVGNVVRIDPEEDVVELILVDTTTARDVRLDEQLMRGGHADPAPASADAAADDEDEMSHLLPRFGVLEVGATPNYAEIHEYLRDGILLDFVDEYRRHVPSVLPPRARLSRSAPAEPVPEPQSQPVSDPDSDPEPEPELELELQLESEPEPQPQPDPAPVYCPTPPVGPPLCCPPPAPGSPLGAFTGPPPPGLCMGPLPPGLDAGPRCVGPPPPGVWGPWGAWPPWTAWSPLAPPQWAPWPPGPPCPPAPPPLPPPPRFYF